MSMTRWRLCAARSLPLSVLLVVAAAGARPAVAQSADTPPPGLEGVDIIQRLGSQVPLELPFKDEAGREVRLQDYVRDKPVILTLVYYECPMLCTLVLNGALRSLRALSFDVGREFEVLTVSFDPEETPALARAKKDKYLHEYGRAGAESGWHFLTGPEPSIRALTDSVGFRYRYDPAIDQYAHATAIMVLSPSGKVSHYFYGVEYPVRDLRLALVEAADEKIGDVVDKVLLYCFHYDPQAGRYGLVVMTVIRVLGTATAVLLALYVLLMIARDRRRRRAGSVSTPTTGTP
ncbi:MAG: SCO family protein [Deltaproteobacteria bacterium]|nr:SCO family protein [Deltaproteobacteria bacterium]